MAALGFGLLSAAALPPFYALPVLLVTVPALLALIDGASGPLVAARRGWWFGFGLNLVGLYWITEAILIEAARFWWCVPFAVPALAATLAGFVVFATGLARLARPGWPRLLTLAGAWVLGDLARQFIGTGFPWNPLGSGWEFPGSLGDVLIQPAALVGIHGLTLVSILLAGLPSLGWGFRVAGLAVLGAWAGFGLSRTEGPARTVGDGRGPGIKVVLVQGDVPEGQKWSRERALQIFERYLALTRQGVADAGPGAKVIVWPETASPYLLGREPAVRQAIVAATGGMPALVGAVRFDHDDRPRNSLLALAGDAHVVATYDKWHLVPFGEYQPSWFPVPFQVVPGEGFAAGAGPATLHVPGLPPFGPLICYEAIFPGEVIESRDRPDWMVNITNDAWFGNSTGPRQHLAAVRMRAVEEGLPVMRAANTGISAAFDAHGHELAQVGMNRTGVLVVPLPGALAPTPFARLGLLIPLGIAAATTVLGLLVRPSSGRKLANTDAKGIDNETFLSDENVGSEINVSVDNSRL
ncbi:MAG: apolipoprotein N-acyltransferase [Pseudomonadota bacterium]|nr:apolipoprotein N-acyltransferase [Pseudomonadota bacterium]